MIDSILLVNIFSSFFMCGVIWLVQLVHYPFFFRADRTQFTEHIRFHGFRISFIVLPVMTLELISSILLTIYAPDFQALHLIGLIVVLLIWVSTFLLQVPQHAKLVDKFDENAILKLVRTNWIRTILWSIKSGLALYLIASIVLGH
tara:strand:+ start:2095 stop:2532 length:438 start_codon:yes stop_codon:yes gene_type:complete